MLQLPQIKTTGTLSEKTYEILKKAIIQLELKPGELITVENISEQLGVSRTPIRTALNRLINDGLIEMIPGKGTFVKSLSQKEATDLLNVRELLECYSVKLAAELRTEDDLKQLEYILNKAELTCKRKNKNNQEFLTLDSEFHETIARISSNSYLEKQLSMIVDNCRRYLNATTFEKTIPDVLVEHKELYEQIKKQDILLSEACMKKHITNIKDRMIYYINLNENI